jgi:hypothetical protein
MQWIRERRGRAWEFIKVPQHSNALVALFSGLLFIATCLYTFFAARQLSQMKKATKVTQDTLTLTRQQLVGTLGAVVKMNPFDFAITSTNAQVQIALMNIGHVPARNVRVAFEICKETLPNREISACRSIEDSVPLMEPAAGIWNQQKFYPLELWERELGLIQNTKMAMHFEGNLSYENGFGDTIPPEHFCWDHLQWEVDTMTTDRGLLKESSQGTIPCSEVEVTLRNAEQRNEEQRAKEKK